MTKPIRIAFAAALFLITASSACAPGAVDAASAPPVTSAQAAPEDPAIHDDPALCAAAGGTIKTRGLMAINVCVRPYADAGKVCRDKADCLGACFSSGETDVTSGADLGLCQRETDMPGCFAEVRDGKAQPVLCGG